jgi:hypothetical protein
MKKALLVSIIAFLFTLSGAVFAQNPPAGGSATAPAGSLQPAPASTSGTAPASQSGTAPASQSGTRPASVSGNPTARIPSLPNPLKVDSLTELFKMVVNAILSIGYVVVAFFLILSGFKFVTAQGSEDKLKEAKTTFKNTIIGAVIIVGAQTIAAVLETVFKSLQI